MPEQEAQVEQFYPLICECEELETLRGIARDVDACAVKATKYEEELEKQGKKKDIATQHAYDTWRARWGKALGRYEDTIGELAKENHLSGKEDGTGEFLPVMEAIEAGKGEEISGLYCSNCYTRVPTKLKDYKRYSELFE